MLSPDHIEEIFLAFLGAGALTPSRKLLAGLAEATGKTEKELREQYRTFARSMTERQTDPFEE